MKNYLIIKIGTDKKVHRTDVVEVTTEELSLIIPVIEAVKQWKPDEDNMKTTEEDGTYSCNFCIGKECKLYSGERTARELYGHLPGFEIFNNAVPFDEDGMHNILSVKLLVVINEIELKK